MKNFKFIVFPSYVTALYNSGEIKLDSLMDTENWGNIFSGRTVTKIKQLNSFTGVEGSDDNGIVLRTLGLQFLTEYVQPMISIPSNFRLLETLMSDGRESEYDIIFQQLHNFGASFNFVRSNDGTYAILLNELHELDSIQNRYVQLRSNMGALIDNMSELNNHDDIVCEPIVQSYMMNNI